MLEKVMRGEELQRVLEKYWYTSEKLDKKTIMAEVEAYLDDIEKKQKYFTLNLATLKEDIAEYIFNEYFIEYRPLNVYEQERFKDFIKGTLKSLHSYEEATKLLCKAILETAREEEIFGDKDRDNSSKRKFDF